MAAVRRGGRDWCQLLGAGALLTFALLTPLLHGGPARGDSSQLPSVLVYVVRDNFNGEPETLPEIATRFLGSPAQTSEIADLNRGLTQKDGKALDASGTILPGWVLRLPDAANGPDLQLGLLAVPSADNASWSKPAMGAVITGLVAAASGVVVLRRRARRHRPGDPDVTVSRSRADESAAWTVDRAVRVLAGQCEHDGIPLPTPYLVTIDGQTIALSLTTPRNQAPSPWTARDDGRSWTATLRDLQPLLVPDGPAPYPELVVLGSHEGRLVLLDLSRARGIIAVTGEPALRRALLDLWIHQLQQSPWSQPGLALVRVGFGADDGSAVASLDDADEMVRNGHCDVLVLGTAPGRRESTLLESWVRSPNINGIFVVSGEFRHARWTFALDRDGRLATDFLSGPIDTGLTRRTQPTRSMV